MLLGDRVQGAAQGATAGPRASSARGIGTDAGQDQPIRERQDRPSLEALVRLADALEVSVDYLVREDAPRRNLDGAQLGVLGQRLGDFEELSDEDRASLISVLDGFLAKSRLKALAGGLA